MKRGACSEVWLTCVKKRTMTILSCFSALGRTAPFSGLWRIRSIDAPSNNMKNDPTFGCTPRIGCRNVRQKIFCFGPNSFASIGIRRTTDVRRMVCPACLTTFVVFVAILGFTVWRIIRIELVANLFARLPCRPKRAWRIVTPWLHLHRDVPAVRDERNAFRDVITLPVPVERSGAMRVESAGTRRTTIAPTPKGQAHRNVSFCSIVALTLCYITIFYLPNCRHCWLPTTLPLAS